MKDKEQNIKTTRRNLSRVINHKINNVLNGGTLEFLGCSMEEHIENQFESGNNYGRTKNKERCWHLDTGFLQRK
jgi:hypothetical protein